MKEGLRDELFELAIDDFRLNLEKFRKICAVKTICMHGSPLSKWDNRDLWKRYDYRDFGIIAEPYFDVDFDEVFYLTDTGRRWDGDDVSVRDKVEGTEVGCQMSEIRRREFKVSENVGYYCGGGERTDVGGPKSEIRDLKIRYTWDVIEAVG